MQTLILCGGMGTRMGDLTEDTPKCMLNVNERPFLAYQLQWLKQWGHTDIILGAGHLRKQIRNYFRDGKKMGISIHYSKENEPLGTAGAIKNAEDLITSKQVLILNGDVYCQFNLHQLIYEYFIKYKADHLIVGKEMQNCTDYGVIDFNYSKRITNFREKPMQWNTNKYINAGIYLCDRDKLMSLIDKDKNVSLEKKIFPQLLKQNLYISTPKFEDNFWIDYGSPNKYELLKAYFARRNK